MKKNNKIKIFIVILFIAILAFVIYFIFFYTKNPLPVNDVGSAQLETPQENPFYSSNNGQSIFNKSEKNTNINNTVNPNNQNYTFTNKTDQKVVPYNPAPINKTPVNNVSTLNSKDSSKTQYSDTEQINNVRDDQPIDFNNSDPSIGDNSIVNFAKDYQIAIKPLFNAMKDQQKLFESFAPNATGTVDYKKLSLKIADQFDLAAKNIAELDSPGVLTEDKDSLSKKILKTSTTLRELSKVSTPTEIGPALLKYSDAAGGAAESYIYLAQKITNLSGVLPQSQ